MHDFCVQKSTANDLIASDAAWKRNQEKHILRLEEKTGISSTSKDTMEERITVLELAIRLEEQNERDTMLDDECNRTSLDKDASIVDGSEIDLQPQA